MLRYLENVDISLSLVRILSATTCRHERYEKHCVRGQLRVVLFRRKEVGDIFKDDRNANEEKVAS